MVRKLRRRKDNNKRIADKAVRTAKRTLRRRPKNNSIKARVEFLHSGSTTLNLALSGKGIKGGWARGRVGNIVGDGSSGKTLLALELAFWCWKNIKKVKSDIFPATKKIRIVYNNCEGVMDFPLEKMYGKKFVENVEWVCEKRIEKMGRDYISDLMKMKPGHFLLYIIDSWDAIKSVKDEQRTAKAIKEDKEEEGSYNLEKQKYASSFFSTISGLMDNNNIDASLILISQVRTKIGVTFGKKTYRTGGKALDFYTHQVAWVREVEKLTTTKRKMSWVYGIKSEVKVERSKVSKPFRASRFTILYDYGIDDIDSQIDFLWGSKTIEWDGKNYTKKDFIKYIEGNNLEDELAKETERVWNEIESSFEEDVQKRKSRY